MKVLSIQQPWASLIVIGSKKIETRSRLTHYRGPVLIHASKGKIPELLSLQCTWTFDAAFHVIGGTMSPGKKLNFEKDLPFGAIIGMVEITDCKPVEAFTGYELDAQQWPPGSAHNHWSERSLGNYSPGRFGWVMANPVVFSNPIPAKGNLGFWEYNGPLPESPIYELPNGIKHGIITTTKITNTAWKAACDVIHPLKYEVEMNGNSRENAIDKLKKFLQS